MNDSEDYAPYTEPEKAPVSENMEGLEPEQIARIKTLVAGFPVRSLGEVAEMPIDPEQTLLGDRFLCIGGILMLVAPTGVGKSTAVADMAARWSLGKDAFGIHPAFALNILLIQAENDDGDMTEMVSAVYKQFTPKERKELKKYVHCVRINRLASLNFMCALDLLLKNWKPHLVILDPLNAYTGGNPSDPDVVTPFLRALLNPLLERRQCGALIVHHTPKTRAWDTGKWKPIDWVYAAAGNNDISNAVRAMLVIEPTEDASFYRFIAAKRGPRIGWTDDLGAPIVVKVFRHAKGGKLLWSEATEAEAAVVEKQTKLRRAGRKQLYPTRTILKPLRESENGLTVQELMTNLNRKDCQITKSTLYRRLTEEMDNGLINDGQNGVYSLTNDGNKLFL